MVALRLTERAGQDADEQGSFAGPVEGEGHRAPAASHGPLRIDPGDQVGGGLNLVLRARSRGPRQAETRTLQTCVKGGRDVPGWSRSHIARYDAEHTGLSAWGAVAILVHFPPVQIQDRRIYLDGVLP